MLFGIQSSDHAAAFAKAASESLKYAADKQLVFQAMVEMTNKLSENISAVLIPKPEFAGGSSQARTLALEEPCHARAHRIGYVCLFTRRDENAPKNRESTSCPQRSFAFPVNVKASVTGHRMHNATPELTTRCTSLQTSLASVSWRLRRLSLSSTTYRTFRTNTSQILHRMDPESHLKKGQ